MKKQWKRTLSVLLSIAMLFSMTGMNTVFATEGDQTIGASGLCEHHTEHRKDVCGYTEGTPEILCGHEHTDECYKEVTECVHEHRSDCYPAEDSVSDNDATPSDASPKEPTECIHNMCSEESGCVTKELDCLHEHDGDCGYVAAVPGTPCAFVCEECAKDSGEQNPPPADNGLVQIITDFVGFDGFTPLDTIEVTEKSTVAAIGLPGTLNVTLDGQDGEAAIPVTWETADGSDYEVTEYETYDFIPVWDAEAYTLADGLTDWDVPFITVNIGGMDNPNTKDVTTAAALKTALTATTPATINVMQDIALPSAITLGADHTLNIAEGKTVSTGNYTLTIPDGKTLTLSGTGTLKVNSAANYATTGIRVVGTLKLSGGSNLAVANASGNGIQMRDDSSSGKLESNGGHITIANSRAVSYGISNGSATLTGGSLTVENTAGHGISGIDNMTISDCTVTVNSGGDSGIMGAAMSIADSAVTIANTGSRGLVVDTLTITGGTVEIANTGVWGLRADALTVKDHCAVTVANSGGTGIGMDYSTTAGEFNLKDSTLTLKNTGGTGLDTGKHITMDNSTIAMEASGGRALWVAYPATVVGTGSVMTLVEGVILRTSSNPIFSDRGVVHQYSGDVTVTAENDSPSNRALTAGDYVWDGTYFTKSGTGGVHTWNGGGADLTNVAGGDIITITNTATGTLTVPEGATVTIIGNVTDANPVQLNLGAGAKVNWVASYAGSRDDGPLVHIPGTANDTTGTIEITGAIINDGTADAWAITANGDVIVTGGTVIGTSGGISAGNVTINADSTITSTSDTAITADNDVIIGGGTITGGGADYPIAIVAVNGSITLAGCSIRANPGARAVFTNDKPITVTGHAAIIGEVGVPDGSATTITINSGGSLTVLSGLTITVNKTGTIINNGAIYNEGAIVNSGTIVNNGSIVNDGTITNHGGSAYTGADPTGNGTFTPPPSATSYFLTVTNGTGGGSYAESQTVTITANAAPSGQQFKEWTVNSGGVTLSNPQAQSTTFTMPANAVAVTATYEALPVNTYSITVLNDGNGTASANVNSAQQGATITLTATASSGYRFKEWQVVSGGVNIANNSFTMPAANVTVKAAFERIPTTTHTITFNAGGGSVTPASAATGADGRLSSLPTPTRSGSYRFDGWFTAAGGGTQITTATVFTADQTVYAHWTYTGGSSGGSSGGGGGSSSGGGSTTTVTPPAPSKPDTATNAETKVTPTVAANGSATVTVPEKSVTDAIKAAQDAAKKAGTEKNGISVTINATTGRGASDITATLTEKSVDALIKAGVTEVRMKSDAATISIDLATLKALQAVAGGAITVSAKPVAVNTLSAAAQQAIGNRPVFQLTLTSGGKPVTSFGGGSVSVAIPYTLLANEKAGNVQAVYVDGSGRVTWLTNSSYDTNTKVLLFSTGHFSVFGVGYKQDVPAFTDIANHWAKSDIEFVAARGLLSGTGNNRFSPNNSMTRGMFVTALGRLAGVDTNSYKTGKFTDVKADAYYAPYVNWAAEKGIVSGATATTFDPDSAVTRQEMAVIMANYAKAMGYTAPKSREAVTFADSTNIASWAKDAVKAMQMAGVIDGKDGNRFDPTGTATRAEVAAVLHRYVELVIDPATAQGWTQNDAGQWLYYENGKPVTGWKQVDGKWYYLNTAGIMQSGGWKQIGGKWYYLYADGSMAVSTKIDGYEVGPDGAWKES